VNVLGELIPMQAFEYNVTTTMSMYMHKEWRQRKSALMSDFYANI
jgi:hypothetical protein